MVKKWQISKRKKKLFLFFIIQMIQHKFVLNILNKQFNDTKFIMNYDFQ